MSNPQRVYTTVDGQSFLTKEYWLLNGQLHRTNGPAWQCWEIVDGRPLLTSEEWFVNDKIHRVDGPAVQYWEIANGQPVLTREEWCLNNQRHRLHGPAYRARVIGGQFTLTNESWYVGNIMIDPEELRAPVRRIERWWLLQRARRHQAIEQSLLQGGMTVWPGLMGLLKKY